MLSAVILSVVALYQNGESFFSLLGACQFRERASVLTFDVTVRVVVREYVDPLRSHFLDEFFDDQRFLQDAPKQ